jgi:flagellar protein FlaG
MDISAIQTDAYSLSQATRSASAEVAQRRQVIQAARTVNESGVMGQNQLVFLVDRQTHRPIIRVEDRETHEVVMQLPPEYVLRLADELRDGSQN